MGSPLAAVSTILEENKEKLVPIAAFTAIGSCVYVCCKLKTWFQGQQSDPVHIEKHRGTHILNLPPEVRTCIWDYLKYKDVLKLRLVCDEFKNDVDTIVGVRGYLDCQDQESFTFFRSIALRKCSITNLYDSDNGNIFAFPYHIEQLKVLERTSLSIKTLKRILNDCNNVKTLSLRFNHRPDTAHMITPISRIVLNSLRKKLRLKQLELIKIPSYNSQSDKSCPQDLSQFNLIVPNELSSVHVELPDVNQYHLSEWKYFLEQQSKLSTLTINFGGIPWQFFKEIIPRNGNTLKFVCLYQLKSFDADVHKDFPLDWEIFKDCTNLEMLQITGYNYMDNISSINFPMLPVDFLQELCIRRVVLSRSEVRRIYKEMPVLKHGSFENFGREGDIAAAELMMELHQAEVEREMQEWEESQQLVEIFSECVFHFCVFGVFSAYSIFFYVYYIRDATHFQDGSDAFAE